MQGPGRNVRAFFFLAREKPFLLRAGSHSRT